jgi:hypothetical protein
MNDIYELKAQKYKLKYEKLLQELIGGTLNQEEYKAYERAQIQGPVLLPKQTYQDYLQTKKEYEAFIVARSQTLTQAQVPIPSYIDYMRMTGNFKANVELRAQNQSFYNNKQELIGGAGGTLEEIKQNKNVIWNKLLELRQKLFNVNEKLKNNAEFISIMDNINKLYDIYTDINFELNKNLEQFGDKNERVLEITKNKQIKLLNTINDVFNLYKNYFLNNT